MQAVILVGGQGTRLRPLTTTRPKPIVPLVDRPFMAYMLEWLASHQITDVVMLCGFLADAMTEELGDGSKFGVNIRWIQEPEPRGTAGALQVAAEYLDEQFVLLNGDVLTDLDLTAQINRHNERSAVGTLALVPVEDPSAYGLVQLSGDEQVAEFLEKPDPNEITTDLISAGAYVLNRSILDLIPRERMVSIEREVWPRLVGKGLYGCVHRGAYWMDIGTPQRYLEATDDILSGRVQTKVLDRLKAGSVDPSATVASSAIVHRNALVDARATVGERSLVREGSVVGPDAVIADDVILEGAVVLKGALVKSGARLRDCVVGERAIIESGVVVSEEALIGDDCVIGENNHLARGARVAPEIKIPPGALRF